MARVARNVPCSHTTKAGNPCRAWAVEGTDPPACSAHAGRNVGAGGPPANQNARTHGFYGRILSQQELADLVSYASDMSLDDEISCTRVALRRALEFVRDDSQRLDHDTFLRALGLIFHGARAVAYLVRLRQELAAAAGHDPFLDIIDQALDALGEEWGIEL
jgi:hypothetical protein